jgi:hypothetical protein
MDTKHNLDQDKKKVELFLVLTNYFNYANIIIVSVKNINRSLY